MDEIISQLVTDADLMNHTIMLEKNAETKKITYVIAETGETYTSYIEDKNKSTVKYLESRAAENVVDNIKIMDDVNVVVMRRYINKQAKDNCMACELNDPNQDRHTCMTTPWGESVDRFFNRGYALKTDNIVAALYGAVYRELYEKIGIADIVYPKGYNMSKDELMHRVKTDTEIEKVVSNTINRFLESIALF